MDWLKKAKRNDLVFIYFSGHGAQIKNYKGKDGGKDEAFVVKNKEMILDDDFFRWVSKLKSKNIITVVDACFSKGLKKSGMKTDNSVIKYYDINADKKTKTKASKINNIFNKNTLIASAYENSIAREDSRYGGVFTTRLIRALNSGNNIGLSLGTIFKKVSGNKISWGREKSGVLRKIKLSK